MRVLTTTRLIHVCMQERAHRDVAASARKPGLLSLFTSKQPPRIADVPAVKAAVPTVKPVPARSNPVTMSQSRTATVGVTHADARQPRTDGGDAPRDRSGQANREADGDTEARPIPGREGADGTSRDTVTGSVGTSRDTVTAVVGGNGTNRDTTTARVGVNGTSRVADDVMYRRGSVKDAINRHEMGGGLLRAQPRSDTGGTMVISTPLLVTTTGSLQTAFAPIDVGASPRAVLTTLQTLTEPTADATRTNLLTEPSQNATRTQGRESGVDLSRGDVTSETSASVRHGEPRGDADGGDGERRFKARGDAVASEGDGRDKAREGPDASKDDNGGEQDLEAFRPRPLTLNATATTTGECARSNRCTVDLTVNLGCLAYVGLCHN